MKTVRGTDYINSVSYSEEKMPKMIKFKGDNSANIHLYSNTRLHVHLYYVPNMCSKLQNTPLKAVGESNYKNSYRIVQNIWL